MRYRDWVYVCWSRLLAEPNLMHKPTKLLEVCSADAFDAFGFGAGTAGEIYLMQLHEPYLLIGSSIIENP